MERQLLYTQNGWWYKMAEITIEATINGNLEIFDKSCINDVSWKMQNSGDYTQPFYGVIPAVGQIKIIDKDNFWFNSIMSGYIVDDTEFKLKVNGNVIGTMIASKDGTTYDYQSKIITINMTDKCANYENIMFPSNYFYGNLGYVKTMQNYLTDYINVSLPAGYELYDTDNYLLNFIYDLFFYEKKDARNTLDDLCLASQSIIYQDANGNCQIQQVFSRGEKGSLTNPIILPLKSHISNFSPNIIKSNKYLGASIDYLKFSNIDNDKNHFEIVFPNNISEFDKANKNMSDIVLSNDGSNYYIDFTCMLSIDNVYYNYTNPSQITKNNNYFKTAGYVDNTEIFSSIIPRSQLSFSGCYYTFDYVNSKAEFDAIVITDGVFGKFGIQIISENQVAIYGAKIKYKLTDALADVLTESISINLSLMQGEKATNISSGSSKIYSFETNAWFNSLVSEYMSENTSELQDFIATSINEKYNNGLITATLDITPMNLYSSTTGILMKNWTNGEMLEVGDIVRIDKDNQGTSAMFRLDGTTPYYWQVCSTEFEYSGVPKQKLELLEFKVYKLKTPNGLLITGTTLNWNSVIWTWNYNVYFSTISGGTKTLLAQPQSPTISLSGFTHNTLSYNRYMTVVATWTILYEDSDSSVECIYKVSSLLQYTRLDEINTAYIAAGNLIAWANNDTNWTGPIIDGFIYNYSILDAYNEGFMDMTSTLTDGYIYTFVCIAANSSQIYWEINNYGHGISIDHTYTSISSSEKIYVSFIDFINNYVIPAI